MKWLTLYVFAGIMACGFEPDENSQSLFAIRKKAETTRHHYAEYKFTHPDYHDVDVAVQIKTVKGVPTAMQVKDTNYGGPVEQLVLVSSDDDATFNGTSGSEIGGEYNVKLAADGTCCGDITFVPATDKDATFVGQQSNTLDADSWTELIETNGGTLVRRGFRASLSLLEAGDGHTCAVTAAGQVKCWGEGAKGQRGSGNNERSAVPTFVMTAAGERLTNVVQVVSGMSHSCALAATGKVKCWGSGYWGHLGNGTFYSRNKAVDVQTADGELLTDIVQITAGTSHTCALTTTGNVKCWGSGKKGELGHGRNENKANPVDVQTFDGKRLANIVQVSAGAVHTCALTNTSIVKCWGGGNGGQLGNGTFEDSNKPIEVGNTDHKLLTNTVQIYSGVGHSCALAANGTATCWGHGYSGELGDSERKRKNRAVTVRAANGGTALSRLVQISAGHNHTCALDNKARGWCWGLGQYGKLGHGEDSRALFPVQVEGVADLQHITAGEEHTCALRTNGYVYCWGRGKGGLLGNGLTTEHKSLVPVAVLQSKNSQAPLVIATSPRAEQACYVNGTCHLVVKE